MTTATDPIPLVRKIEPGVYKVRSKSHPTACHTVREERSGLSCNCPARVKCWHIKEIEAMRTAKQPEPTFIPILDPSDDDDPFAEYPILEGSVIWSDEADLIEEIEAENAPVLAGWAKRINRQVLMLEAA